MTEIPASINLAVKFPVPVPNSMTVPETLEATAFNMLSYPSNTSRYSGSSPETDAHMNLPNHQKYRQTLCPFINPFLNYIIPS